jgi:hypothetical protein
MLYKLITGLMAILLLGLVCPSLLDAQQRRGRATDDAKVTMVADLSHQYQEEIMAKTLYEAFAEKWKIPAFTNIASRGETYHSEAILARLKELGSGDPLEGKSLGEFEHPEVKTLYDRLLAQGMESMDGAIRTGLEVEEFDIAGLRKLQTETSNRRAVNLYAFLEQGSHHHLQAFSRQAQMRGVAYEPKHLSKEDFDAIVKETADPPGRGMGSQGPPESGAGCCGRCGQGNQAEVGAMGRNRRAGQPDVTAGQSPRQPRAGRLEPRRQGARQGKGPSA